MSYYHDDDGSDEAVSEFIKQFWVYLVIGVALALAIALLLSWAFDPVRSDAAQTQGQELRCETLIVTAASTKVSCTDTAQLVQQSGTTTVVGGCDESLWQHVYNPTRLEVHERCVSVTGVLVDATHGKRKDGVRKEADGDCHGWLKLDAGQEKYLNAGNVSDEEGNLVFEIVHMFKATQKDAVASGVGYANKVKLPPVGSHVRVTGSWVMDDNHARWNEIHPVSSIEVLK